MSQANSTISDFGHRGFRQYRSAFQVGVWFVVTLVVIDLAINVLFSYPQNLRMRPSQFQAYFEYGRSTEGQIRRMTRPEKDETAPITLAGWYNPLVVKEFTPKKPENPIITFYGSSQAVELAFAVSRVSEAFTPRSVGAPGATANWAYGAYLRDRGGGKSRAVVLAFQSLNLAMITSFSPMIWAVDAPMPYMADRFFLNEGKLGVIHPPYTSYDGYVATLSDPEKWAEARSFFARQDPLYNPLSFRETVLDHSSLFRLAHRAYGQHFIRSVRHAVLDQSGYRIDSEAIKIAKAIIHEFAIRARRDGVIPVIYLVNDLGYSNYLTQALSPTLRAESIPYLSSDKIVPPNDPRGFLPDGHFTNELDDKLARALEGLIAKGDNIQSRSSDQ